MRRLSPLPAGSGGKPVYAAITDVPYKPHPVRRGAACRWGPELNVDSVVAFAEFVRRLGGSF